MKKITVLLFFGLFSVAMFAQEQHDFNRWSIELEAGVHKPARSWTSGYYTSTPDLWQGGLGVRYMLSNRFGLKLGAGYNQIETADESRPAKSRFLRFDLQGVANAGDILNFRSWTNTINLLVHGGMGYGLLTPQEPVEKDADQLGYFTAGITPQVRLTDHIALTGDFSGIVTFRQDYKWDGTSKFRSKGFDGILLNGSIGLTFYLGSAEKHADWYGGFGGAMADKLDSLGQRVGKIEDGMLDTDKDGVANYLDQEPNTTNGVAVNTKGVAVDKNGNGIPDELEDSLDERYASTEGEGGTATGMIAKLLNQGYVNVYFEFDSTEPQTYSLNAINYCIRYMKENPNASAELIGYADEIGNTEYNAQLSEARAQKVKDIMVAAGIDASRLTITGQGEDASVEKGSQPARQLVRRVTFRLNGSAGTSDMNSDDMNSDMNEETIESSETVTEPTTETDTVVDPSETTEE